MNIDSMMSTSSKSVQLRAGDLPAFHVAAVHGLKVRLSGDKDLRGNCPFGPSHRGSYWLPQSRARLSVLLYRSQQTALDLPVIRVEVSLEATDSTRRFRRETVRHLRPTGKGLYDRRQLQ